MIFITKKAFEDEVLKRLDEQRARNVRNEMVEETLKLREEVRLLKDEVSELKYRIARLEDKDKQNTQGAPAYGTYPVYEPAPYWTNPNWKAPDVTCTVPQMDIVKDAVPT